MMWLFMNGDLDGAMPLLGLIVAAAVVAAIACFVWISAKRVIKTWARGAK